VINDDDTIDVVVVQKDVYGDGLDGQCDEDVDSADAAV
jgi:hypothetical protein